MYGSIVTAIVLWLIIAVGPAGPYLEASLLKHVLIEIPLLIIIGIFAGNLLKPRLAGLLGMLSIPAILLACFTLAFWMIPRWLDASLGNKFTAYMKYLSLPLLAGIPLSLSWQTLHPIARGVVKIEFLAMLFRLGWIYLVSPDRLCNNYLLGEQQHLGYMLILVGFVFGLTWLVQVFIMAPKPLQSTG